MAVERKKKEKRTVSEGKVFVQATFNNTLVTVTDMQGNALSWASAGGMGFKGAKKSTPYAAQVTTEAAFTKAKNYNMHEVHVYVKGPGMGRESAIRAVINANLHIRSITDTTPIPHNGCRPKKSRRV